MTEVVVGVAEAHNRLSELIEMVGDGTTVAISRRGVIAARLVPPAESAKKADGPSLGSMLTTMVEQRGRRSRSTTEIEASIRSEREAWD